MRQDAAIALRASHPLPAPWTSGTLPLGHRCLDEIIVKGRKNETDCANHRRHGRCLGVRDNAQDANLPRRIDGPREPALPTAAAAAPSSSASDRELPGRIDGPGGDKLSASAATAAATAGAQIRRTRLNLRGRR